MVRRSLSPPFDGTCPTADQVRLPEDVGKPSASIADLLGDLSHGFRRVVREQQSQRTDHHAAQGAAVAGFHARVLQGIAAEPGCTARDLAEKSGRDKGQVARVIKDLEDQGLITRQADASDRRVSRLSVSRAGQQVCAELMAMRQQVEQQMVSPLTEQERVVLASAIQKMLVALEAGPRGS